MFLTIQLNNIILKQISTSFLKYNLVPALEFTFVQNPSDGSRDPSWFPRPLWRDDFASHMSVLVVDDLGSWSNQNVPQGVDKLTQKNEKMFSPKSHQWLRINKVGNMHVLYLFSVVSFYQHHFEVLKSTLQQTHQYNGGCLSQSWGVFNGFQHSFTKLT